ncbi:unnamed protein product [Discosporangium mesarthrocarpum]
MVSGMMSSPAAAWIASVAPFPMCSTEETLPREDSVAWRSWHSRLDCGDDLFDHELLLPLPVDLGWLHDRSSLLAFSSPAQCPRQARYLSCSQTTPHCRSS